MAFALDQPSTIQYQTPSWLGGVMSFAGAAVDDAQALYDGTVSYIDPLLKAPAAIEQNAVTYIEGGVSSLYSSLGNKLSSAASAVGGTINSVFSSLSSGLKWGLIVVGLGLVVYAFALAQPFIPRGGR